LAEQDLGFRKIQLTGRESYIISLPKEWMTTIGLKKGDQLAFKIQEDSSLLLVPRKIIEDQTKESSLKEYTIHITSKDDPQSISRRIMSLYAIGADQIRIRFREGEIQPEQKMSIKNTLKVLLGSEITAELSNGIYIQILINNPIFPVDQAIRRMLVIAQSMDKEAVSAMKNFNESLMQNVIASDDELDRLNLYVIRQLKYGIERNLIKEMKFSSTKEFLGYRIVTKNIENVGDNAVSIAKNLLNLKNLIEDKALTINQPIDEEVYSNVLKFNSYAHTLLEDSVEFLFKRDYYLADEVISRFMSTGLPLEKDASNNLLRKRIDPNLAFILWVILDNSRKMMEYARDIAEVTLNRTVEEISKP
jgi:phosphate uptake regulator